ncbi:MAG: hypothetical protein V4754_07420 [Pseudomonadota bacterium]
MRQDLAVQIDQSAVDPTMGAEQGVQWWADVSAELDALIAAPDSTAAAGIIAWWHHDHSMIGQTSNRVAGRIRRQAAQVLNS